MSHLDIELYEKKAGLYNDLQHCRPDYVGAERAFADLSLKYLSNTTDLIVTDFCCGTGSNTKILAGLAKINEAFLIDINPQFLEIAKKLGIKSKVMTIESDILKTKIEKKGDVVISMFAYHHVPDKSKSTYLEQVKKALKPGGILILGEIYSPDRVTTLRYYKQLFQSIPKEKQSKELKEFLTQTAESDDFEYKVAKAFADEQLSKGFELIESRKIWPTDDLFPHDVGTFVEVWKLKD